MTKPPAAILKSKLLCHESERCNFIEWSTSLTQPDADVCRTQWGICLERQKTSNKFDIFLMASRGEFLTENLREEMAELPGYWL